MVEVGVKTIVYSDGNDKLVKIKLKDYIPKTISLGRRFINNGFSRMPTTVSRAIYDSDSDLSAASGSGSDTDSDTSSVGY
jgi:hypothetical protein